MSWASKVEILSLPSCNWPTSQRPPAPSPAGVVEAELLPGEILMLEVTTETGLVVRCFFCLEI